VLCRAGAVHLSTVQRVSALWSCGAVFQVSVHRPLLKKAGLDSTDVKKYRPISNLTAISKLLEDVIPRRLLEHLKANGLLPSLQSAYHKCHSMETANAMVLSEILMALDHGDEAALTLLDLSAAFTTRSISASFCAVCVYHMTSANGAQLDQLVLDRPSAVRLACWNAVNA